MYVGVEKQTTSNYENAFVYEKHQTTWQLVLKNMELVNYENNSCNKNNGQRAN